MYITVGLFDEWNSENFRVFVNEELKFETNSTSNISHYLRLCDSSTLFDRKLGISITLDNYLENESLNISFSTSNSTKKFGVYTIEATLFENCPQNSKIIGTLCTCNEGFFHDYTDVAVSLCIRESFSKAFFMRCTICPPLCKKCHKDQLNDAIIICDECESITGIIKTQDGCRPINSKILIIK